MGGNTGCRFRAFVTLCIGITSCLAAPLATPLAAQTTLRGQVDAVRGSSARVVLEGELVPSPGDSVRLGDAVTGLGEVALSGAWTVDEVGSGWVWVEPSGPAPRPLPGYWARLYSSAPRPQPMKSDAEPSAGVEVLRGHDFAGGATGAENDGPGP